MIRKLFSIFYCLTICLSIHAFEKAVDKNGRRVQGSQDELLFSVEGPAEIVGVVNGDIASDELTVGDKRKLYRGTATVILRSKQEAGKVVVTAVADGLKKTKQTVQTVLP